MEFSAANTLNFIIFSAAPGTLDSGGFTITTNAWQHVVATWSPAGIFAYVNGKLAASNTSGTGVLNSSATLPMELCADHNFSTWYGGAIDDVRMWQRALPAREVWQVYLDSLQGYPATLSRTLSTPNVSVAPPSARKRIYVY
jgi:hypothetical protein